MIDSRARTRQFDIIPESCLGTPITVVGAGAVGSWSVFALAKMGFDNIRVIDYDIIEIENMAGQLFGVGHIGLPKVDALAKIVSDFTGSVLETVNGRYQGEAYPGIVVSAVDRMDVRKAIWEAHRDRGFATKMVIDPRMGSETAMLLAMNPNDPRDVESYEKTLYTDDKASHEPCTRKATTYCAIMLSGLVAKCVKDVAAKVSYPRTANWSVKNNQLTARTKEVAPAV